MGIVNRLRARLRHEQTPREAPVAERPAEHAGMRVAVVGNCQVTGIAAALEALLPGAVVEAYHVGVHPLMTPAEIARHIDGYDFVVTQMLDVHGHPELELGRLRTRALAAGLIPPLVFTGFHPDAAYIFNEGKAVASEVGFYHSAIAAAGFLLGLPAKRTLRLYNAYVYETLGYFSEYARSREALAASFAQHEIDLLPHLTEWERGGCFMHTINHPKIDALSSLATLAAQRAGLVAESTQAPAGIADPLEQNVSWAVYPEISDRLGFTQPSGFLRTAAHAERSVTLDEMVTASYNLYRDLPEASLLYGNIALVHQTLKTLV